MFCKRFNELEYETKDKIATYLFNKKYHLINELIERKNDDLKLSSLNKEEIEIEMQYVNSKHYVIDLLEDCNWAVFDADFNMYIFETKCK